MKDEEKLKTGQCPRCGAKNERMQYNIDRPTYFIFEAAGMEHIYAYVYKCRSCGMIWHE